MSSKKISGFIPGDGSGGDYDQTVIASGESPDKALAEYDIRSEPRTPEYVTRIFNQFLNEALLSLSDFQKQRLIEAMETYHIIDTVCAVCSSSKGQNKVEFDESFDLKVEISEQIRAVRALRSMVLTGGQVKMGITPREVKDTVATAASMISTLMKYQNELLSLDRRRILEQATIDVLREMGGEVVVDRFVQLMEGRLAA